MTQSSLFSSGFQLAPFVTSSGLLLRSWNAICSANHHAPTSSSNVGVRLSWNVHKGSDNDDDLTIVAFEATPPASNLEPDLVPSSTLKDKIFDFLSSKNNTPPYFSVNKAAVNLFYDNVQMLDQLKTQIRSFTRLIVTGQALGGSIAILFTLSLLHSIGLGKNRPLCIAFGSPLIGDKELQRAVSRSSAWNSCFLNVVSHKDPLPKLFIRNQTLAHAGTLSTQTNDYVPFGTFLFCYDANSACSENPASILELLKAMASTHDHNQGFQSAEYGNIVQSLCRKAICRDITAHGEQDMIGYSSLHASVSLQLWALGLITPNMQQQKRSTLVTDMEKLEKEFISQNRTKYEETKKLNDRKTYMALLEWYKKVSKNQNIGYYDRYKKGLSESDQDVITRHKQLRQYWEKLVEEAEMKPQKDDAALRTRWLYGGTNYRRMVEPLDIAVYYSNGGRDYVNKGRSRHYKRLEELLQESQTTEATNSKKDVESILTFDSCFWAHVEEALLLNQVVKDEQFSSVAAQKKEEAMQKLIEFEDYVYGLLKKYEVSSEIFLSGSSYMFWWNEYKQIVGVANHSNLATFMSNAANYRVRYVERTYDFS